jgi:hypothetical protein
LELPALQEGLSNNYIDGKPLNLKMKSSILKIDHSATAGVSIRQRSKFLPF